MAGTIRVREEGRWRRLYFDETLQGGIDLTDPTACTFPVTEAFHLIAALRPAPPQAVLVVGLGAGELPRSFLRAFPRSRIRVVEIDPVVVQLARRFFALPHRRRLEVVVADGIADLERRPDRYDLIVLDACGREGLPAPFVRPEFVDLAARRLTPTGMLAANLFDLGSESDSATGAFQRHAGALFPERYAVRVGTRGSFSYLNLLLFCGFDPGAVPAAERFPPGVAVEALHLSAAREPARR
ncbi:MAG: spermidine synthase [Bacillota bacterium]